VDTEAWKNGETKSRRIGDIFLLEGGREGKALTGGGQNRFLEVWLECPHDVCPNGRGIKKAH